MKNLFAVVLLIFLAATLTQAQPSESRTKTTCFKSSMHCESCENTIFETLRFQKGVKEVKTDLPSNTIKVVYDGRKTSGETIGKVIQEKGYKADVITEEEYKKLVVPEGEVKK